MDNTVNQNIVINTYNESSLHQTLKNMYAIQNDGKTEVSLNGYIYDVISNNGTIIEIQTKNLSSLTAKLSATLENGLKVKLIHPVVISKQIITTDTNGTVVSNRKSPKKGNIYDIFRELTGIYPLLLNKNFTLEILEITLIENRTKTSEDVQSKNKNRRFKKDWIKTNKKLDEILNIRTFNTKEDYLSLLPSDLPEEFSSKNITELLKKSSGIKSNSYNYSNLILWVYLRMGLIENIRTEKRLKIYKIA